MLNKKFFVGLKKDYFYFNSSRREVIGRSSDALHKAKIAIFSLQRGQVEEAGKTLFAVEKILKSLEPLFKKREALRYEGSHKAALEEYVEAKMLYKVVAGEKIDAIKELRVDFDSYLAGLCDTTGELVRLAIREATDNNIGEVEKIRDIITEIMSELVVFNLTSYLRTKYDQAKGNLKKIEQIVYELKLRK